MKGRQININKGKGFAGWGVQASRGASACAHPPVAARYHLRDGSCAYLASNSLTDKVMLRVRNKF